ncbi:hypothetical protein LXA43DRAFT_451163 [Ganoderma leucocontextum]|nr:hypothetical protein LXA43DRAFT_451163 [Ganoderma leucocontextum]
MLTCVRPFYQEGTGNQLILFERAPSSHSESTSPAPPSSTKLPSFLSGLLSTLDVLLRPCVPPEIHAQLLFSLSPASYEGPPRTHARRSPTSTGLVRASLPTSASTGMGTTSFMTGEARYGWTHGLNKWFHDWVAMSPDSSHSVQLHRDMRLSDTFR